MKIADEIREVLEVLWRRPVKENPFYDYDKGKIDQALSQILTLIDKENEAMRNINEGKLNAE